MTTIALVDESRSITGGITFDMASALEINIQHLAAAWHIDPVAVEIWPSRLPLPRGYWPIYFVDDNSDAPGVLGEHYVAKGRPEGRVYVQNNTGLNSGDNSVTEAASHEALEMILNPRLRNWSPAPGRPGYWTPVEVCDAVQDHYGITVRGTEWRVSNFVHPSWYEHVVAEGTRFDHLGTLNRPGEIGPQGYLVLRAPDDVVSNTSKNPVRRMGRSERLLDQCKAVA